MKRSIFVLAVVCFFAGCDSSKPDFKIGIQNLDGAPLKAEIKAAEQLPVKVDIQGNKGLPADANSLRISMVSLEMSRENWIAIGIIGASAVLILLAAVLFSTAKRKG